MSTTQAYLQDLINQHRVILFMKGDPSFPQCGFSQQAVSILEHLDVPFHTVNVLENNDIREGIKVFSQWPTIPQLYIDGEFVGGSDIMMEMWEGGELEKLVEDHPKQG